MWVPIVTCEHAGNTVPDAYARYFTLADKDLQSHRGWDPGAREAGVFLAQRLGAPFHKCETTRLLVEPNRSLHSDSLFSSFVHALTDVERDEVISQYYVPHRHAVEAWIKASDNPVVHLSVHTFTPVFDEVVRDVEIGLLFDPDRLMEATFCGRLHAELERVLSSHRIRFNEPYKGIDDGFTTYLRTRFPDEHYAGIEIEINQRFVGSSDWEKVVHALADSVQVVMNELGS